MLDVLCRQDPSFLYRTLSCLKALHTRLRGDPAWVRALLPVAQFFLHHGEPPPSRGSRPARGAGGFPLHAAPLPSSVEPHCSGER